MSKMLFRQHLAFVAINIILGIQVLNGNIIPPQPNPRMFTSQMSGEGQFMLANNLQFLCSLKPSNSDIEGDAWLQPLQKSILDKISKPGEPFDDYIMKATLTKNILDNAVSNCDTITNDAVQDQPQSQPEKLGRQTTISNTNYVENIMHNIFSGNIMGMIKSYSGRNREQVSSTVSDIFRTMLTNINAARSRVTNFNWRRNATSTSTSTTSSPKWLNGWGR